MINTISNKLDSRQNTLYNKLDYNKLDPISLNIRSKASIIHIGSLDSFDITDGGKNAAKEILEYFEKGKTESLEAAIEIYDIIIPNENFRADANSNLCVILNPALLR